MKNPKPNAALVWKQIEDCVVPRLGFSVTDRAVYSHLLRHSRLEGKRRLRFSITRLARAVRLTGNPVRNSIRKLAANGVLRLLERSKAGHVIELFLPDEIRAVSSPRRNAPASTGRSKPSHAPLGPPIGLRSALNGSPPATLNPASVNLATLDIEAIDFLRTRALRKSIHARENGRCFYCLRRITARMQCLDHVHPRAHMGLNSYRNLVSTCLECNSRKGEMPAKDFLRWLYREQRLTPAELTARLRALQALAAGHVRPAVAAVSSL